MEFKWGIFLVALSFSLTIGALSNVSLFLYRIFDFTPEVFSWLNVALSAAAFFLSPVLLFVCLFLMGRNIDLVAEFLSVVVPLFIGSWVGHLIGYYSFYFLYIFQYDGSLVGPWIIGLVWHAFVTAFSAEFFVGFAALSMAYITTKRS